MAFCNAHTGNCIFRFVENLLSLILVRTIDTSTQGSMLSVSRVRLLRSTDGKSGSLIKTPGFNQFLLVKLLILYINVY